MVNTIFLFKQHKKLSLLEQNEKQNKIKPLQATITYRTPSQEKIGKLAKMTDDSSLTHLVRPLDTL